MVIISSIYILCLLILSAGFLRFILKSEPFSELKISIITAAKNEAAVIHDLIYSIIRVDYPVENYELIIADDNSTDDTYKVSSEIIKGHNNIKILSISEKTLPGKRSALLKGIEVSAFPFIVITDADCVVSAGLLKCFSAAFKNGYEFVFGPSVFFQKKSIINLISCMENLKNQFLSFSMASLGMPYTAAGRNMGFSKDAFFKMGGYSNTAETSGGDDDLLLREAAIHKLKVKAIYDENILVYSHSKNTLNEYLNQKARHTRTSFYYPARNKIILGSWHLLNLFMIASPFLMFLNMNFIWLFIVKMIADITILSGVQRKFGYHFNLLQIFYLNILYELFIVINFFNAMFRKFEWK